jgi:hypothetical protein
MRTKYRDISFISLFSFTVAICSIVLCPVSDIFFPYLYIVHGWNNDCFSLSLSFLIYICVCASQYILKCQYINKTKTFENSCWILKDFLYFLGLTYIYVFVFMWKPLSSPVDATLNDSKKVVLLSGFHRAHCEIKLNYTCQSHFLSLSRMCCS